MPKGNLKKDKNAFSSAFNRVLSGTLSSFTLLSGVGNQIAMANPPKGGEKGENQQGNNKVVEMQDLGGKKEEGQGGQKEEKNDSYWIVFLNYVQWCWDSFCNGIMNAYNFATGGNLAIKSEVKTIGNLQERRMVYANNPEELENFERERKAQQDKNIKNAELVKEFMKEKSEGNIKSLIENNDKISKNNEKLKELNKKMIEYGLPVEELNNEIADFNGKLQEVMPKDEENIGNEVLKSQRDLLEEQNIFLKEQNEVILSKEKKIRNHEEKRKREEQLKKTKNENFEIILKNEKEIEENCNKLAELKEKLKKYIEQEVYNIKDYSVPCESFKKDRNSINGMDEKMIEEIISLQDILIKKQHRLIEMQKEEIVKAENKIVEETKKAEEKIRQEEEKKREEENRKMKEELEKARAENDALKKRLLFREELEKGLGQFLKMDNDGKNLKEGGNKKNEGWFSVVVKFEKLHDEVSFRIPEGEQGAFQIVALIRVADKYGGKVCAKSEKDKEEFEKRYKEAESILESANEEEVLVEQISEGDYPEDLKEFYEKYLEKLESLDKAYEAGIVETFRSFLSNYVNLRNFYEKMYTDEEMRLNRNIVKNVLIFLKLRAGLCDIKDKLVAAVSDKLEKEDRSEFREFLSKFFDEWDLSTFEKKAKAKAGDNSDRNLNTLLFMDTTLNFLAEYYYKVKAEMDKEEETKKEISKRDFVIYLDDEGKYYLAKKFKKEKDFSSISKELSYAIVMSSESSKNCGDPGEIRLGVIGNSYKNAKEAAADVMLKGEILKNKIDSSFKFLSETEKNLSSDEIFDKAYFKSILEGCVGNSRIEDEELDDVIFWVDKAVFALQEASKLLEKIDENDNREKFSICSVLFHKCFMKIYNICFIKGKRYCKGVYDACWVLLSDRAKKLIRDVEYDGVFFKIFNYCDYFRCNHCKADDLKDDKNVGFIKRGDWFKGENIVEEDCNIFKSENIDAKEKEDGNTNMIYNNDQFIMI